MDVGRAVFLGVALTTHGILGYAIVRAFTTVDPRVGLAFGVLPDVDFLFPATWGWPFVHRGLTHSPAFAIAVVVTTYAIARRREVALAVGLALGSHLAIDAFSAAGIAWLVPIEPSAGVNALSIASTFADAGVVPVTDAPDGLRVHGPVGTALLWVLALAFLGWRSDRPVAAGR